MFTCKFCGYHSNKPDFIARFRTLDGFVCVCRDCLQSPEHAKEIKEIREIDVDIRMREILDQPHPYNSDPNDFPIIHLERGEK